MNIKFCRHAFLPFHLSFFPFYHKSENMEIFVPGGISNLSDIRDGRLKKCRLVLVHRWTSTSEWPSERDTADWGSLSWHRHFWTQCPTARPTISRNGKTTLYAPTTRAIRGLAGRISSGRWCWNTCKGQSSMCRNTEANLYALWGKPTKRTAKRHSLSTMPLALTILLLGAGSVSFVKQRDSRQRP